MTQLGGRETMVDMLRLEITSRQHSSLTGVGDGGTLCIQMYSLMLIDVKGLTPA